MLLVMTINKLFWVDIQFNYHIIKTLCIIGTVTNSTKTTHLVGDSTNSEGTIKVCHDGLWGLVTDAGWDTLDPIVVCRQLQLPTQGELKTQHNAF